MSVHKTAQCHVSHRGRVFHFVSYEGRQANPTRAIEALPAMWFLMSAGRRFSVVPECLEETAEGRDTRLAEWLDANVFLNQPKAGGLRPNRRRAG
ncbi:MAG: hypothetical protein AB7L66_18670 [Gemmatimonadales bacterium]